MLHRIGRSPKEVDGVRKNLLSQKNYTLQYSKLLKLYTTTVRTIKFKTVIVKIKTYRDNTR